MLQEKISSVKCDVIMIKQYQVNIRKIMSVLVFFKVRLENQN